MLKITPTTTNINSLCRTCLVELTKCVGNKHDVYKFHKLGQLLAVLTSQVVHKKDKFPTFICQKCYEKIQILNEFRTTTLRSLQVLGNIISSSTKDVTAPREIEIQNVEKEDVPDESCINKNWLEFDYSRNIKVKEYKEFTEADYNNEDIDDKRSVKTSQHIMPAFLELEEFPIETGPPCKVEDENELEEVARATTTPKGIKATIDHEIQVELFEMKQDNEISGDEFESIDEFDALAADEDYSANDTDNDSESSSNIPISQVKNKAKVTKNTTSPYKTSNQKTRKKLSRSGNELRPKKFEVKFHCELCPRRFISQDNLDAHLRTHKGLKAFQCNQCERGYNKLSRLRQHIRDTHAEDQAQVEIVCSFEGCGKIFRRSGTYKTHYRLKHSNTKTEFKTYICEDCGRTFKNITTLREHSYKHRPKDEYPYKCETCGKRYISHRTFKEHMLRHAGIKNFECHYCGMKKTTRNELRTHINYHTKEKQWPCQLCPNVFNSSANLGMHDRVVHKGVRRFKCQYCNQSFGKPDTLKHHEMRHTGEKPHACHICNKRFIQAVALRTHMKTHAKDNEPTEKVIAKNLSQRSHAQVENHVMDVIKTLNPY